jgi:hypothetical protein
MTRTADDLPAFLDRSLTPEQRELAWRELQAERKASECTALTPSKAPKRRKGVRR